MYARLAIGNAKRSIKDYLIYFITLTLCVSLFYAFTSLSSSSYELITEDSYRFDMLQQIMKYSTYVITGLLAVLVAYVNKYMMKRRQREFATYILLGTEQRSVAFMFFIETLIIGLISIVVGIFIGTLFSQVVTALVLITANQEIVFSFKLYMDTVAITFIFFITMFLIIGLYNIIALRKIKLIEMLNAEKKTEFQFKRGGKTYLVIFIISVILYGICGYCSYQLIEGINTSTLEAMKEAMYTALGLVTFIAGTYMLFYSLAYIIIFIKNRCVNFKYEYTNMVLIGSIVSKIKTAPVLMATISMTFLGAALSFAITLLLSQWSLGYLEYRVPFDINIRNYYSELELEDIPDVDYSEVVEYLKVNDYNIDEYCQVEKYIINPEDISRRDPADRPTVVIKLSDFNKSREMLGYDSVNLNSDEFTTQWVKMTEEESILEYIEENSTMNVNGEELKISSKPYYTESIGQGIYNGYTDNILIFPDELCDKLTLVSTDLVANTTKELSFDKAVDFEENYVPKWFIKNNEMIINKYTSDLKIEDKAYTFIQTRMKVAERSEIINVTLAMRILGIYLGTVMLMISLTVLALQQLTDSIEHRSRFKTLRKLGIDSKEVNKIILKQISLYFIMPISIAIIGFVAFMGNFTKVISKPINSYIGDEAFIFNIGIALGLILIIYVCYFIGTYYTFKRNVKSEVK